METLVNGNVEERIDRFKNRMNLYKKTIKDPIEDLLKTVNIQVVENLQSYAKNISKNQLKDNSQL